MSRSRAAEVAAPHLDGHSGGGTLTSMPAVETVYPYRECLGRLKVFTESVRKLQLWCTPFENYDACHKV